LLTFCVGRSLSKTIIESSGTKEKRKKKGGALELPEKEKRLVTLLQLNKESQSWIDGEAWRPAPAVLCTAK